MPQYLLEVESMRTREEVAAGHRRTFCVVEKPTLEECEAALPEAIKFLNGCPNGYSAKVRITYHGEQDKDGIEQKDMVRDVFIEPEKAGFASWEYQEAAPGFRRMKPNLIVYPVPTKADQIAELERVKADAEAQLAVLTAEEAAK